NGPEQHRIMHIAAIIIQKWWRGTLVRRSLLHATICALVVQKWWLRVLTRLHEERRVKALVSYVWPEKAIVLLQSMFRMWLMKTRYKKYQKAAHIIQNNWRLYSFQKETNIGFLNNLKNNFIGRQSLGLQFCRRYAKNHLVLLIRYQRV
uniref:Uncharacterized protein n=1 Tax=Salvator merianae TaxID=96440 RepID=A0A8D0BUY1_SALMN